MTKISIIGAGPAGNYLAYLLAKNDFDVSVIKQGFFLQIIILLM